MAPIDQTPREIIHTLSFCHFRAYRPEAYRRNRIIIRALWLIPPCLFVLSAGLSILSKTYDPIPVIIITVMGAFFCALPIGILRDCRNEEETKWTVLHKKYIDDDDRKIARRDLAMTDNLHAKLDQFMSKDAARERGRAIFVNVVGSDHSPVSISTGSGNAISGQNVKASIEAAASNQELADAIAELTGYVAKINKPELTADFNELTKNMAENTNKGTLKLLWKGFVAGLPDIITVSEAVEKLTDYFAGSS